MQYLWLLNKTYFNILYCYRFRNFISENYNNDIKLEIASLSQKDYDFNIECNILIVSGVSYYTDVWLQIQADILNMEIYVSNTKEQASLVRL